MQLPALQGTFDQQDFFIYAACDQAYFSEFGPAFIGSIRANTDHNIHIHLFNPTAEQIAYCQRHGVGVTWEHVHRTLFVASAQRFLTCPTQEPDLTQYNRTLNAMSKGGDASILERMQKTYYACARFVRLAEMYQGQTALAMDVDAVVRRSIAPLPEVKDFYLHYVSGKNPRYLAGGIWLAGNNVCKKFLNEYANQLRDCLARDHVYWSLDQDILEHVVPKYSPGQLPREYIDWNMRPNSYIWTAKGTRKELAVFVNEKRKYTAV